MTQWVLAAAFVVTWSSGFVGASLADQAAAPSALLAWRYLLTAAVLAAVCLATSAQREIRTLTLRTFGQQAALGALSHVVFLGGVFGAAASGLDAGLSALICALQPMLVAAAGCAWFGDRLRLWQWLGLAIGILGVALGVGGVPGSGVGGLLLVTASLLALCAAALLERRWKPRTSVLLSLTIQVVISAVLFTGYAAVTSGLAVQPTRALAGALIWLVVMSGLGGYTSFIWCLRRLGATTTSTLLYLTPAVTTLWGWLMFQQVPAALQLTGLAVALVGVALGVRKVPAPIDP